MIYEIRSRATRAPLGAFEAETPEEAIAAMLVARGIPSDSSALLSVNLDGLEVVPEIVADLAALGWANDLNGFHGDAGACFGDAFRLAEQDAERVAGARHLISDGGYQRLERQAAAMAFFATIGDLCESSTDSPGEALALLGRKLVELRQQLELESIPDLQDVAVLSAVPDGWERQRADMSNTCEHSDHPAPAGRRFCSDACAECERGGDACSPECLAAGDGAHAPHEKPRPFDGPTYALGKG